MGDKQQDVRIVLGTWDKLRDDATAVRHEVFIVEQAVPEDIELDDMDAVSLHVVAYNKHSIAVGTGRLLPDGHIGRMAVRRAARGANIGARLLQRSTRRFAVTDVGQSVHRHAQSMLAEASAAREVVDRLSAEPRGVVKVSVPVQIVQQLIPTLLPEFLARYPDVRLQLHVSNRRVDVINEGFDVAIRVRSKLDDDGSLVMRSFGQIQQLLVASPQYLKRAGRPQAPDELEQHTTLSMGEDDVRQRWELQNRAGEIRRIDLKPRVSGFDFMMLMALGQQGIGITMLPETLCADLVRNGELEVVLPEWRLPQGIAHAVFASRRGLLPAVRVFIDFLAERLPPLIEQSSLNCSN